MTIALTLAAAFMLLVLYCFAPRRRDWRPPSEQFTFTLLRLAAWLEHVGTALDCAIVRYRMERQATEIVLQSTETRRMKENANEPA